MRKDSKKTEALKKLEEAQEALSRVEEHTHFRSSAGMVARLDAVMAIREVTTIIKSSRSDKW